MRSRICVTVGRPSVCLSHRSTAAAVCGGGFAAERSARRTYRSTAAGAAARRSAANALQHAAQQQMRAVHVDRPVDEAVHGLVISTYELSCRGLVRHA